MAFSFMIPVKAAEAYVAEPANTMVEQGITPLSEQTRIYWRMYHGALQFRVWGMTSGRWLTEWTNFA